MNPTAKTPTGKEKKEMEAMPNWKTNQYSPDMIHDQEGKAIATTIIYCHDGQLHLNGTDKEAALANARLIVTAVNNHAELVTSLQNMVLTFENRESLTSSEKGALMVARAALKKVNGI